MDNTKIYAILKKSLHIQIATEPDGGQWVGNNSVFYNVDGLPPLNAQNILPLIGVDIDTKAKYTVEERDLPHANDIMPGAAEGDGLVELTDLILQGEAIMRGVSQNAPPCVFINASFLKPFISDDEISYITRKANNDAGYIILVKRGLITIAVIAPICHNKKSPWTDKLIDDLSNVISTIKQQQADECDNEQMTIAVVD